MKPATLNLLGIDYRAIMECDTVVVKSKTFPLQLVLSRRGRGGFQTRPCGTAREDASDQRLAGRVEAASVTLAAYLDEVECGTGKRNRRGSEATRAGVFTLA